MLDGESMHFSNLVKVGTTLAIDKLKFVENMGRSGIKLPRPGQSLISSTIRYPQFSEQLSTRWLRGNEVLRPTDLSAWIGARRGGNQL